MIRTTLRLSTLFALLLALGGCGGAYKLQGRVIPGSVSEIYFVSADDARLASGESVGGASILVDRDPDVLGRETVAQGRSDDSGNFSIAINEFGAGWMDEVWAIQGARSGHESVERRLALPSSRQNQRLLIVLARGAYSAPVGQEDLWEQYERFR